MTDVSYSVLNGSILAQNLPPPPMKNAMIHLTGEYAGKAATFDVEEDTLGKHTLFVGGTGCGKTTLMYHFVDQIRRKMTCDDVMLIFDSKGDFVTRFFRPGDVLIGNSRQYADRSAHWNIFREILADGWDDKDIILNTHEICKSFFAENAKGARDPFFINAARDLLASIIICIIRAGKEDQALRNTEFYNDMLRYHLDASTVADYAEVLTAFPDMTSVLSYISDESAQSQGVLSEMYTIMRGILIGVFAAKGMFSVRNFVREKMGKALFIEYDLSIGGVLTPIYRILFDLALKEALGRNRAAGNVYLICDEFKLLPHLEHIDDGVNFGRSLGVKVMAGIQSISQLYEIYGEHRGKNIAAGFSSVYAFRANDVLTRNYIQQLFGKNKLIQYYQSMSGMRLEKECDGNTVEDWDLNALRVGEAVVGLPFAKPFRFRFDMYKG